MVAIPERAPGRGRLVGFRGVRLGGWLVFDERSVQMAGDRDAANYSNVEGVLPGWRLGVDERDHVALGIGEERHRDQCREAL